MRQRRGHIRGQVVPLAALIAGALMGFGGIGFDVGYLHFSAESQQMATDAAALVGAQALVRSGCGVSQDAVAAAGADASGSGFGNGGDVTLTVQNPPVGGPFSGNGCAVRVSITTRHGATFFSRLFGYPVRAAESTQAVGMVSSNSDACIYLLSPTATADFDNDTVRSPGCAIAMNNTATFNGGNITAPSIGYAGAAPSEDGASFAQATPAPTRPVTNPCPEIPGCAYLAANPPSTSACGALHESGKSISIYPGCYSSVSLDGGNVTLNPGVYVFTGSTKFKRTKIQGSGVTLYVTAGALPPDLSGQTVALSPPASGNAEGVLYYQVPANTASPSFKGANVHVSGLIYSPGAESVGFNGNNGNYVVLVFGSANWDGGNTYDFVGPPPNGSIVKKAVLAQ